MVINQNNAPASSIQHGISSYLSVDKQKAFEKVLNARDQAESQSMPIWTYVLSKEQVQNQLNALPKTSTPASYPLYAVPCAIKDNIDVQDVPTTAGCLTYKYTPSKDADVIACLREAGAIIIGKTILDQFATGLVGTRIPKDFEGPVPNPISSIVGSPRITGGSSTGSAAAVATAIVPFALGTDTAGSGRIPAAFNNIVGLKPTPKQISNNGIVPACRSIDCVSIFALSAEDAGVVLAILQQKQSSSVSANRTYGSANFHYPSVQIAVPDQLPDFTDEQYVHEFENTKQKIIPTIHSLNHVSFQLLYDVASMLYEGPWVAERYLALRELLESDPEALDPTVAGIVKKGATISAADTYDAMYKLEHLSKIVNNTIWKDNDLLMVPTAPTHPTIEAIQQEPIKRNSELGTWTNFVNLLGYSAISLPGKILPDGRPFGITFIAKGGWDAALVELGALWQRNLSVVQFVGNKLELPSPITLPRPYSEPKMKLAVVGAHLQGMPLHYQLVERNARFAETLRTTKKYRLLALHGTNPPKPGLLRVSENSDGAAIEVEVYNISESAIGSFLALIPPPLGLGSIELENGDWVKGFICEAVAMDGATDVSNFGGWRAYVKSLTEK